MGRALAWTSGCAVGTGSKQRVKLFKEYVLINKAPEDYTSHKPGALDLARFCLGRVEITGRGGGRDLGIGTKDMREQPGSEGGGGRVETSGEGRVRFRDRYEHK